MTIVEFLDARLAEDERWANNAIDHELEAMHNDGLPDLTREDLVTMAESDFWRRPLREVVAKRAILAELDSADYLYERPVAEAIDRMIRALATVYADHPDYNQAWAA